MEKLVLFGGGSINYYLKGNGPSIVFLHGFLEDHTIWDYFSKRLSLNYRVIAVDLPGFGKSSVFSENNAMDFMAEAVNQILKKESIEKCIVVGHSMGGYVALALAELYSEKMDGIVLFHSHAEADDEQGKINRDRTIEVVKNNHKEFINGFIPLMFSEGNQQKFAVEIKHLQKLASGISTEGIIASLAGMRDRKDQTGFLKNFNEPVFFIIGKQDSRIPLEKILPQISYPKNCEALILEGVGHMGFIEAKEITCLALEHFVERDFYLHTLKRK